MTKAKQILKRPVLLLLLHLGKLFKRLFDKSFDGKNIRNILIFQLGGIGDVLMVFPVFEALSKAYPDARITSLTEHGSDLFKLMQGRNSKCVHLRMDFNKGYLYKLSQIVKLRRHSYDLIIVPSRGDGLIECSIIAFLIGAPYRVGFTARGAGFLHTNKIEFREDAYIVEQNLNLLRCIGIEADSSKISLKVPEEDMAFAEGLLQKHVSDGEMLVIIHPWSKNHSEFKSWPLGNYIGLSRIILNSYKSKIFLMGSRSERESSGRFAEKLRHNGLIDLTGETSLLQTAALIQRAALFIGNDSSLLHVANALNVPSIGIFGATSSRQLLSPGNNSTPIFNRNVPCRPCYVHQPLFRYVCKYDYECLKTISVEEVMELVREKLNSSYKEQDQNRKISVFH